MDNLSTALWITLLGMGLVFGAIILLWVMMIVLTSLTAEKEETQTEVNSASADSDLAQVAALAVAVALSEQSLSSARPLSDPPTALVSAWQLGMRTRQQSEKSNFKRR